MLAIRSKNNQGKVLTLLDGYPSNDGSFGTRATHRAGATLVIADTYDQKSAFIELTPEQVLELRRALGELTNG